MGADPGSNSILNSISLSGGNPGNLYGKISRNSQTTGTLDITKLGVTP